MLRNSRTIVQDFNDRLSLTLIIGCVYPDRRPFATSLQGIEQQIFHDSGQKFRIGIHLNGYAAVERDIDDP